MRRSPTRRSIEQLASLPTAQGGLTRLTAERVRKAGIKLGPLLSGVGLTIEQIDDPEHRISVHNQIAFLEAAAQALNDDFLGLNLAKDFDCRDLGLLYYVMASSDTLGDALSRASRYSRITNEAIVLEYREAREPALCLGYSGIPRHADMHQMEFSIVAMLRVSRLLTGRQFFPTRVSMVHARSNDISKYSRLLGKDVEFSANTDQIEFPAGSAAWSLVDADPRLNKILLKTCEESLNTHSRSRDSLRTTVENTVTPLLPHGQAHADIVAKKLGMSVRTLARRLAEEDLTFSNLLQQLKEQLALRYLEDESMPISRIAWLLGFEEVSSFTHACRRWTGKSPRELRRAS
jgi:AraC-like DNA-binding protein